MFRKIRPYSVPYRSPLAGVRRVLSEIQRIGECEEIEPLSALVFLEAASSLSGDENWLGKFNAAGRKFWPRRPTKKERNRCGAKCRDGHACNAPVY